MAQSSTLVLKTLFNNYVSHTNILTASQIPWFGMQVSPRVMDLSSYKHPH